MSPSVTTSWLAISHHLQLLRRRHTDTAVPEEERRRDVPAAADVAVRVDLGRVVVGHRGRQVQGGLPVPAVRGAVHPVRRPRVHGVRAAALSTGALLVARRRAQPPPVRGHAVGAAVLPCLQLLQGSQAGPFADARVLELKEPQNHESISANTFIPCC